MSEDAATEESTGPEPADDPPEGAAVPANETEAETENEIREPTPQSEALRRQQLYVGTAVSALAGVAVVVAGIQQFPGFSLLVYLLFGMATTTLLFGLLVASMFASAAE